MGLSHPLEYLVVVLEGAGAHAAGEDHHVRVAEVVEGGIDGEAERAVVAADLAPPVADEGDVDRGDALEHLVGADAVEGGEPREQGDGHLQARTHAEVLSLLTTRKRRR
ncbi:MAG TPA: hypothetical protein VMQ59_03880 [Acidimicrobiales bacterium]|nr:hypothetical protein [Acidimicrobiales bacterium]